jgi:signal transduction histidine kinase
LEAAEDPERRAARRRILENRRASKTATSSNQTLATLPLITRGSPVGVLEVVAPSESIEQRWATLEAVASQVAIVFSHLADRDALALDVEGLRHMAALVGTMARARTPRDAVSKAVQFSHQRSGGSVAGWLLTQDPSRFELVSARGVGPARPVLRRRMRLVDEGDLRSAAGRARAASLFAEIVGAPEASLVHAGGAVLLLAGPWANESLWSLESLLEDILANVTLADRAERRSRGLDVGLALTAHEIRGPLTGVLAIIEHIVMQGGGHAGSPGLLERSRDQLEQLSRLVDGLFRWAVAGQQLDLERTDLMAVVREAVEGSSLEMVSSRVVVSGPGSVTVLASPDHLRAAIANVVRNALTYSPADKDVSVSVTTHNGRATVTVHDLGPGVPPAQRDLIFDPFIRGSAAHLARSGHGLGLFIARRVMEAHGGRIWLGSGGRGAAFHLQLPTTREM